MAHENAKGLISNRSLDDHFIWKLDEMTCTENFDKCCFEKMKTTLIKKLLNAKTTYKSTKIPPDSDNLRPG